MMKEEFDNISMTEDTKKLYSDILSLLRKANKEKVSSMECIAVVAKLMGGLSALQEYRTSTSSSDVMDTIFENFSQGRFETMASILLHDFNPKTPKN